MEFVTNILDKQEYIPDRGLGVAGIAGDNKIVVIINTFN